MLTKQELLDIVQELPDDVVFLVSSDEEGNEIREARISVEQACKTDYGWDCIHDDDVDEYEEGELANVAVFW